MQARRVLVAVVVDQPESPEVLLIDRAASYLTLRPALVDVEPVDVGACAQRCVDSISELVRGRRAADESVACIVERVVELEPERIVVVVVVPVVLAGGRTVVLGRKVAPVSAERFHVNLPAEPYELLHDAVVVANAGTVRAGVPEVLKAGVGIPAIIDPESRVQQTVGFAERVVRNVALDVVRTEREASVCALGAAGDCYCRGLRVAGVEETLDIVRMGNPRLLGTGELIDETAVETGTIALVAAVAIAAVLAIHVLERPARSLTVEVLIGRKNRRRLPGVARVDLSTHLVAAGRALLRRQEDDAVRCP